MIRGNVGLVAVVAVTGVLACALDKDESASPGVGEDAGLDEDEDDEGAGGSGAPNGDGGTGTSGGVGDDGDTPPPEQEMEANFRVPRASGGFVYSTSESTNSVAVINSSTLGIEVVAVGRKPTVVLPIDPGTALGAVAVLN